MLLLSLKSHQLINFDTNSVREGLQVNARSAPSIRVEASARASVKRWLEEHHVQCNQALSGFKNKNAANSVTHGDSLFALATNKVKFVCNISSNLDQSVLTHLPQPLPTLPSP